jgi:hypothetical protein
MTMRTTGNNRGSVLVITLVIVLLVAAVGAAWLYLSSSSSRDAESREHKTRSHYIADSGIQAALADMVSASPPAIPFTKTETELAGGDYRVDVENTGDDLFKLTSTGTYEKATSIIEQIVKKTTMELGLDAAFSVQINPNAEVTSESGGVPLQFDGAVGALSGQDHDPDGNLLGDQAEAKCGASLNSLPGEQAEGAGGVTGFDVQALDPNAQLTGTPSPTKNDSAYQGTALDVIVDYARNRADTVVDLGPGGKTVTVNNGDYGTAAGYKTVYVNATAEGGGITFGGNFDGYGILVLEVEEGEKAALDFAGKASWHGLVIVKITDEYTADEDDPANLVGGGSPDDSPHIVGALVLYMAGSEVNWEAGASALRLRGQSRLSYSSEAVRRAMDAAAGFSYATVSYRVLQ